MNKPTNKWLRISKIYARFVDEHTRADFSEDAVIAMFNRENGIPIPKTEITNGYELGKKWMEVTIKMWKQDIAKGLLLVQELLDDGYPEWFLKRIGILKYRINIVAAWRLNNEQSRSSGERWVEHTNTIRTTTQTIKTATTRKATHVDR